MGFLFVLEEMRDVSLLLTMVPICRREEQKEIVRIVDEKLSGIEHSWLEVDLTLKRADRLRQAILKKAFSGTLVYKAAQNG